MSVAKVNFTTPCYSVVAYRPSFPDLSFPVAEAPRFSLMEMDLHITKLHFIGGRRREWGSSSA